MFKIKVESNMVSRQFLTIGFLILCYKIRTLYNLAYISGFSPMHGFSSYPPKLKSLFFVFTF